MIWSACTLIGHIWTRKSRRTVVDVLNSQAYGGMEAHLHGFLTQARHSKSIFFTF